MMATYFVLILIVGWSSVCMGHVIQCPVKCVCNGTRVNCQYKFLTEIPRDIPGATTELFLDGNVLTSITKYDFHGLASLRTLTLTANKIAYIEPGTFNGLYKLLSLQLSDNELSYLNKTLFQNLTSLFILHLNQMSKLKPLCIEDESFGNLKGLQQLYLAKNNMRRLTNNTFAGLESLHILDLSSNNFEIFEASSFKHFKNAELEIKMAIPSDWEKPSCCCSTKKAISSLTFPFVCNNNNIIADVRSQECTSERSCGIVEVDTCNGILESSPSLNSNVTLSSNILLPSKPWTATLPTPSMSTIPSAFQVQSLFFKKSSSTMTLMLTEASMEVHTVAGQSTLIEITPKVSVSISPASTSCIWSCQSGCKSTNGPTCSVNAVPPSQDKSSENAVSGLQKWHIWFIAIVAVLVIVLFAVLVHFRGKIINGRKFAPVDETEMTTKEGVTNDGYKKDEEKP